jgi:CubicO group peptidase (beta-lactamase class C family)
MRLCSFIWLLLLSLFYTGGCQKELDDQQFPSSELIASGQYMGDYWPTDGWRTCSPEQVGMDSEYLEEMNEEILVLKELHVDIHSVLIIKNGYIVAEQYYSDAFGQDSLHRIYSCTKSLVSALMGIAIDQGSISNVDEKMIDYFPEYTIDNMTEAKAEVTLEELLTMSAGLEWYELDYLYDDEKNTFNAWSSSEDKVKFVLDRPMVADPGEEYSYNTGISHVISAIIQKATGVRTDSFGVEMLFQPLGIDHYYWPVDNRGVAYGGNGVKLTPRDMAKFGYLYLKNGKWENEQIVPASWVEVSQQPHIKRKFIPDSYYGYQWWVSDELGYSAVGYAGQRITIMPEYELVVVFTNMFAEGNGLQESTPDRLLDTYIIPAIR